MSQLDSITQNQSIPHPRERDPSLTFEDRYGDIVKWIEKRRRGIDLAQIEWSDIKQLILIRISQQYHMFDPARGEFRKWVNRVITNAIRNIWRDNLAAISRPCITGKGGCVDNMGGGLCRRTKSGIQCSECKAYRDWEARKGDHHAITLPLPLDNHSQEVHSKQSDFMDIEGKKRVIDEKMKERLTRAEWRAYKMLMIQHKPEEEVAKALGFKRKKGQAKSKMFTGYSVILQMKHRFVEMAKAIILENDLA